MLYVNYTRMISRGTPSLSAGDTRSTFSGGGRSRNKCIQYFWCEEILSLAFPRSSHSSLLSQTPPTNDPGYAYNEFYLGKIIQCSTCTSPQELPEDNNAARETESLDDIAVHKEKTDRLIFESCFGLVCWWIRAPFWDICKVLQNQLELITLSLFE